MSIDTTAKVKEQEENKNKSKAILTMKRVKVGTITTAARISPSAAPTNDWTSIFLPRAESWHQGMVIKTSTSKALFTVIKHENLGSDIEPDFRTFIGDENGSVLAVVMLRESSLWNIYTCFPGYEEQKPAIRLASNGKGLYLYGKLCSESRTFMRCTGEAKWEAIMKAEITRRSCCKSPLHATFFRSDRLDPLLSSPRIFNQLS